MDGRNTMAGNFTICVGTVGTGLWVSPDGGDSWRRVGDGLSNESRGYGLAVHPAQPRTVLAGAEDGLYKSRDGGQRLAPLDPPVNLLQIWRIPDEPVDPG